MGCGETLFTNVLSHPIWLILMWKGLGFQMLSSVEECWLSENWRV